ncbi:hypothetical protein N9F27_02525 [Crocinitomicaceae bacterium]|nr:hypothetical protein [Crocinitomicaceae bacterium]
MFLKIASFFIFLLSLHAFGQIQGQFALSVDITGYQTSLDYRHRYMDAHRTGDLIQFQSSEPTFYKKKKVSRILITNENNQPYYDLKLDTSGQVESSRQYRSGISYYSKKIKLPGNSTLHVNQRWQGEQLQKSDSTFYHNRTYTNGDTSIHYSYQVRIVHIQGKIINERNTFYNENYLGQTVKEGMYPIFFNVYYLDPANSDYVAPIPNYYDTPFKTDFDPNKVYLVEHSITGSGSFEVNFVEMDKEKIFEHPHFQDLPMSDNRMYFVDGEEFVQPIPSQDLRMNPYTCGTNYQDRSYATPPKHNGWIIRRSDGLIASAYCDYWEVDNSPEALLENAKKESLAEANQNAPSNFVIGNNGYNSYFYPARKFKFSERVTKYCYEYEFFE